ncbi:hypothetical protein K435DRAFT_868818 [Dendrothele bispora CBS 962.96]|uniref:Uncharacterized protein n=1 Tax=Dendrothele bispora (strain CBS 962.96) TaxID=1314807 RepID=A0A4S8LAW7_DENBC|nr:hypothetical protein K435DRAFT_868818 [Dendrothele bispora CBS 962.96]
MVPSTRSSQPRITRSMAQASNRRILFDYIELPVRSNRTRRVRAPATPENEVGGSLEPTPENEVGGSLEPTPENEVGGSLEPTPENEVGGSLEPTPENEVGGSLEPTPENEVVGSLEPTPENEVIGSVQSFEPTTVPALGVEINSDNSHELGSLPEISIAERQVPENEPGASSPYSDANQDNHPELGSLSDNSNGGGQTPENEGSRSSMQPLPTLNASVNTDDPVEISNEAKEAPEQDIGSALPPDPIVPAHEASVFPDAPSVSLDAECSSSEGITHTPADEELNRPLAGNLGEDVQTTDPQYPIVPVHNASVVPDVPSVLLDAEGSSSEGNNLAEDALTTDPQSNSRSPSTCNPSSALRETSVIPDVQREGQVNLTRSDAVSHSREGEDGSIHGQVSEGVNLPVVRRVRNSSVPRLDLAVSLKGLQVPKAKDPKPSGPTQKDDDRTARTSPHPSNLRPGSAKPHSPPRSTSSLSLGAEVEDDGWGDLFPPPPPLPSPPRLEEEDFQVEEGPLPDSPPVRPKDPSKKVSFAETEIEEIGDADADDSWSVDGQGLLQAESNTRRTHSSMSSQRVPLSSAVQSTSKQTTKQSGPSITSGSSKAKEAKGRGKAVDKPKPVKAKENEKAKGREREKEKDRQREKEKAKAKANRAGKPGEVGGSDEEDEEDEDQEIVDDVEDPEDPAYEPNAEKYPKKPGPIPNDCLSTLNKLAFEFSTEVYKLARQYGKSPDEMYEAAGLNKFKTRRSESTWNCFQVYMCVEKHWKRGPNETQAQFTGRLVKAYEAKLKSKLGDNWTRVDLRREAMYKYVRWYQQARRDQIDEDSRQRGVTLRRLNKAVKEVQKLGRALYEADDVVLIAEIHDMNNSNRSKYTGYGPKYEIMMKTQQNALSKKLKYNSAQLVVARSILDEGGDEGEDPDITEIKTVYKSNPNDLDTLRKVAGFCFDFDIKLATDGRLSKMYWTNFGEVAYEYHLQMVFWPLDLPAIGPKNERLVHASKGIPNRALRKMVPSRIAYYRALGKKKENRTDEEQLLVEEGFAGPQVVSWNPKDFDDVGDVGLIVDEEGDVVLSVADVLEKRTGGDNSDSEGPSQSKGSAAGPSRASKSTSSSGVDKDDATRKAGTTRVTPGNNDDEDTTDDEIPKPPPKRDTRAKPTTSSEVNKDKATRKAGRTKVAPGNDDDDTTDDEIPKPPLKRDTRGPSKGISWVSSNDSSDDDDDIPYPPPQTRKPDQTRKGSGAADKRDLGTTISTSTAHAPLPATDSTNQDFTRASTVLKNFVEQHRTARTASWPKRRIEEAEGEQAGPSKRTKVSGSGRRIDAIPSSPPSSPAKSHNRMLKKTIRK